MDGEGDAGAGFSSPTTTQTPDALFDYWLPQLKGSELRVLLFLVRRTYGWRRAEDAVSVSQFVNGIVDAGGRRITAGCGVSRSTAIAAVGSLVAQGLVVKTDRRDAAGGDAPPAYRLQIRDRRGAAHAGPFSPVNTTQTPDALFDYWLPLLSDGELRVLLYIVRRTLGFGKRCDVISPAQFTAGVHTRAGAVLDEGCGAARSTLYPALARLTALGLITVEHRVHPTRGQVPARYGLVFSGESPSPVEPDPRFLTADDAGTESRDQGSPEGRPGGSGKRIRGVQRTSEGRPANKRGGSGKRTGGVRKANQGRPANKQRGVQKVDQGIIHYPDPQQTDVSQQTGFHFTEEHTTHHQQTTQPASGGGVQEYESGTTAEDDGVLLAAEFDLRTHVLGDDEVLIDAGGGRARARRLATVVRGDILASEHSYLPVRTEVYYSATHFLCEGGEEWTSDELRRMAVHDALYEELARLYAALGTFSVAEALREYFADDLAQEMEAGSAEEQERVVAWLRYVRGAGAAGLTNPAGFLRSRLQMGGWPPRSTGTGTERSRIAR